MIALLAAVRAIHFGSLMLVFGGSGYGLLLQRAGLLGAPLKGARLIFAAAATLALVSALVWLCLIAGQMSGDWRSSLDLATIQLVATATRFGHVFLGRIFGLGLLFFFIVLRRRPEGAVISVLAGLLLVSLGPVSHAAAGGADLLSIGAVSDAAHLLAAGFWFGGLVVLTMFMRRRWGDPTPLLGALRIFSTWGTAIVALLLATGVINAISILPMSEMILHSRYFELLLVKIALASLMIGLASLNRWHFAPAVPSGGDRVTRELAMSVRGELALGICIVVIAATLGLMAPH